MTAAPINRTRAYRIVKQAAEELGIQGNIGMLSLRKTMGYHAWEQGYQKDAITSLCHHPSREYTMEYLGIEEEEDMEAQQLLKNIRI